MIIFQKKRTFPLSVCVCDPFSELAPRKAEKNILCDFSNSIKWNGRESWKTCENFHYFLFYLALKWIFFSDIKTHTHTHCDVSLSQRERKYKRKTTWKTGFLNGRGWTLILEKNISILSMYCEVCWHSIGWEKPEWLNFCELIFLGRCRCTNSNWRNGKCGNCVFFYWQQKFRHILFTHDFT